MRDEVHLISGIMAAAAAASCTKFCEQSGWPASLPACDRSIWRQFVWNWNCFLLLGLLALSILCTAHSGLTGQSAVTVTVSLNKWDEPA